MSLQQALRSEKPMHNRKDILALSHFQKLPEGYHSEKRLTQARQQQTGKLATSPITRSGGDGTVLEVTGSGKTQELKIKFPEVGLKKVLASVAPIEKK